MTVELANNTRTVQATGSSSYTISLPKKWVDEHGIDAGMELSFYPAHGGELVLKPDRRSSGTETSSGNPRVDIAALPPSDVRQAVNALYATGSEGFVLTSESGITAEQRRAASRAVSGKTGLEVSHESETELALGMVIDTAVVSLERTVLQLQYATLSIQRNVVRALVDGTSADIDQIGRWHDDAQRRFEVLDGQFRRALADVEELDRLGHTRRATFDRYTTAQELLAVVERFRRVADLLHERNDIERVAWAGDFDDCAQRARALTEEAVDAVLTAARPAYDTVRAARTLRDDATELHRRADAEGADSHVWALALVGLERSATSASEIAERAVQASLRQS